MEGGQGALDKMDIALMAVAAASALVFYVLFLFRHPLPYGIDGPYYLTQVRAIERTGWLKYGDPPLAFYYFYALSVVLGDRILAVKLGTALAAASTVLPSYCLLKLELRGRWPALLGSLALAFSPHVIRLSWDFLKNLLGSVFFLASLYFYARSLRLNSSLSLAASSAFLLLASLTHSLAFAINLALLILYSAAWALLNRQEDRKALKSIVLVLAAPIAVALIGLALLPEFFSDILKGKAFVEVLFFGGTSFFLFLSPLLSTTFAISLSGLLLGLRGARRHEGWSSLLLASSLIGLAVSLPLSPPQWAWRFALMGFLPVTVALAVLAREARDNLLSVAVVAAILIPLLAQTAVSFSLARPSIRREEYMDLLAMSELVEPRSVVVTSDVALGYWAEYVLDCDFARWLSLELFRRYDHVLLLLRIGTERFIYVDTVRFVYVGRALMLVELFFPAGATGPRV